jgi:hypothetical protein
VEAAARVVLLLLLAALMLNVAGVHGESLPSSPGDVGQRVRRWIGAKFRGVE